MARLPVLISGSGLSGLLVAQGLAARAIPFHIYESDESSVKRAQGYRLRMSTEGMEALQSVLSPDAWKSLFAGISATRGGGPKGINAITGEVISINGKSGSNTDDNTSKGNSTSQEEAVKIDRIPPELRNASNEQAKDADRPRRTIPEMRGLGAQGEIYGVSRGFLRAELMKSIGDRVHYGKRAISYQSTKDSVTIQFADGTSSPAGSLLIGADGVHSRIARQVSQGALRLYDTRSRMIHGQTTTTAFKALGEGVFGISDQEGNVRVICNVRPGDMDEPQQTFGWTMVGSPGVIETPDNKYEVTGIVAADLSRSLTQKWSEKLRPIFEQQEEAEAGFWKMTTSTPEGVPDWPNDPRVTVVGDAAHSMTPAGGNGANTALQTAAQLVKMIQDGIECEQGLTSKYEDEMRRIASPNVRASFQTASDRFKITDLVEEHSRL